MLISSNRPVEEWDEVFGDQVVAVAILVRLLHHSHVVTIRGNSYLLREKRRSGLFRPQAGRNLPACAYKGCLRQAANRTHQQQRLNTGAKPPAR